MLPARDVLRLIAAKRAELHQEKLRLQMESDPDEEEENEKCLILKENNDEIFQNSSKSHLIVGDDFPNGEPEDKTEVSPRNEIKNVSDNSALSRSKTLDQHIISDQINGEILECSSTTDELPSLDISNLLRKYSCPNIKMLRTGEYSPNNPELAGDGKAPRGGDVFLGLGLYEEKRKKLLQKRQNEYREYLAKQTHLNSLKKQKSNRIPTRNLFLDDDHSDLTKNTHNYDLRPRRPSSVGVQTDPEELTLMALNIRPNNTLVTQAERELSPRPSVENQNTTDWRMLVEKVNIGTQNNLIVPPSMTGNKKYVDNIEFVPSIGGKKKFIESVENQKLDFGTDYFDPFTDVNSHIFRKDSPRAKLLQDLRHTYMPSLFDADAIRYRNMKVEEETAAKRTAYQMELKKQIDEQQRIREERKAREKLLEEAETRRLEEQLKMLKLAQESEIEKQKELSMKMRKDTADFERRRQKLQNDIESEKRNLKNVKSKTAYESQACKPSESNNIKSNEPVHSDNSRKINSRLSYSHSPTPRPNHEPDPDLLSYNARRNNPYVGQDMPRQRVPYSTNIPDNSIFSQSIPVKNYNSGDVAPVPFTMQRFSHENRSIRPIRYRENLEKSQKANKPSYEPAFLSKRITEMIDLSGNKKNDDNYKNFEDSLPIPVLREPDKMNFIKGNNAKNEEQSSDAMKKVEHKWQVPAVQKNILRNNFTEDGKQENILTQLGSIRRQLQLEQLKLDQSQFFNKPQLIK